MISVSRFLFLSAKVRTANAPSLWETSNAVYIAKTANHSSLCLSYQTAVFYIFSHFLCKQKQMLSMWTFFSIPFLTWCLAACGSSPHAQHWCPIHGNRPSAGNDMWAPDGPAPPRWSRSHVQLGSGYAPWVPTLQRENTHVLNIKLEISQDIV